MFVLLSFCAVTFSFAAADVAKNPSNGSSAHAKPGDYYSTKHSQPKLNASAKGYPFPPATDIAIYNGTNNIIFVMVPFSPINDVIYPHTADHIYHDTMYADTHIVLQDPQRFTFFDRFVCRHANIMVSGGQYNYHTTVDCY